MKNGCKSSCGTWAGGGGGGDYRTSPHQASQNSHIWGPWSAKRLGCSGCQPPTHPTVGSNHSVTSLKVTLGSLKRNHEGNTGQREMQIRPSSAYEEQQSVWNRSLLTYTEQSVYIVSLHRASSHISNAARSFYDQVGIQRLQSCFSHFNSLEPMFLILNEQDAFDSEATGVNKQDSRHLSKQWNRVESPMRGSWRETHTD